MKVYTVELEIFVEAHCPQEAFEIAAYQLENSSAILNVKGICEPYCAEGEEIE